MSWLQVLKYWSVFSALLPLVQDLVKEGLDVVAVVQEGVANVQSANKEQ